MTQPTLSEALANIEAMGKGKPTPLQVANAALQLMTIVDARPDEIPADVLAPLGQDLRIATLACLAMYLLQQAQAAA